MEWVETTGRTVAEALDRALDQLGVHEDDVEYEVVSARRGGLLGRLTGGEVRIRARVRPISREKPGDRRRRGGRSGDSRAPGRQTGRGQGTAEPASRGSRGSRRSRGRSARGADERRPAEGAREQPVSETTVSIEEQARAAEDFTRGLVEAFGANAAVTTRVEDEDTLLVEVEGADLGLLVGPKGATLQALEDLVRTVVQRRTEGRGARIHVDVAGYRARRREALTRFVRELAEKVLATGREQALEPMGAADRKVVHDTVAELDGVTTMSEGEEPRRRVVLRRS